MSGDLISRKAAIEEIYKEKYNLTLDDKADVEEIINNMPTALNLESAIERLKENEEDVLKAIEENSKSEFEMIKIKDLKELFKEYTQEQIEILKSAANATDGKIGGD